jgi:HPt (histidine-containing phosphotransfer) domain-containing protein
MPEPSGNTAPADVLAALTARLNGKRPAARRLARLFVDGHAAHRARLAAAAAQDDPLAAAAAAHQIRGVVAIFGAGDCLALARQLEENAGLAERADWHADLQRLDAAFAALAAALAASLADADSA